MMGEGAQQGSKFREAITEKMGVILYLTRLYSEGGGEQKIIGLERGATRKMF